MSPFKHAKSSAEKFGGTWQDYMEIHEFLDSTKLAFSGWQHRSILHNTFGVGICEKVFGPIVKNSEGKEIEVRYIAMQHIKEDLGYIPTIKDWVTNIKMEPWMVEKPKPEIITGNLFRENDILD